MQQEYKVCVLAKATPGLMGIAAYRAFWPIRALNSTPHFSNSIVVGNDDIVHLIKARQLHRLAGYDLYVLQRMQVPPQGAGPLVSRLRKFGGKVIFDTDDDLTNEHRDLGYDGWMESVVSLCDAVTVSTPALGKVMEQYGKPVYVLPNHIDTAMFAQVSQSAERVFDKLTIGTIGGRTHWGDYIQLKEPLLRIKAEHDAEIVIGGYNPPYFREIEPSAFSTTSFEAFPGLLRQFDIRLCPLDTEDPFNASKSACSILEASAAVRPVGKKTGGAAVVCSNIKQFRRVAQHGHNALIVKDGDWYTPIKRLIENRILRQKIQLNALKWVKKHRDISLAGPLWARAYMEVLR